MDILASSRLGDGTLAYVRWSQAPSAYDGPRSPGEFSVVWTGPGDEPVNVKDLRHLRELVKHSGPEPEVADAASLAKILTVLLDLGVLVESGKLFEDLEIATRLHAPEVTQGQLHFITVRSKPTGLEFFETRLNLGALDATTERLYPE
ncbi:MAG: hypothetical protein JNL21_38605 [Myxococcales bacterium]|nr:hypothetical protein [Myxococcales bacterium]